MIDNKTFEYMEEKDLISLNAGGVVGATVGFLVGTVAGTAIGCYAAIDSLSSGSSSKESGVALMTSFSSAVISCTIIGAVSTSIF